jgi:hypothetical protein
MFAALPSDLLRLVLLEASPRLRLVCREWRDVIDAAHDATVRPRLEALLTSCCCVARYVVPRGMVLRYAEGGAARWAVCDEEGGCRYRCARCRRRVQELGGCHKCKGTRTVFPWPRVAVGPSVSLLALAALALSLQRPR